MSTQCRFCGEAVRPDSMFCPACGQLIGATPAVVPPFGAHAAASATERQDAEPPRAAPQIAPVPLPTPLGATASPAASSAPEAGRAAPAALATGVRLPDGRVLPVDRALVFGRSPESGAAKYRGSPVRLDDPERAMSRVHLVLSPATDGVTAMDPGSANGTLLERGEETYALVAGTPSPLLAADRLLLGDAVLTLV